MRLFSLLLVLTLAACSKQEAQQSVDSRAEAMAGQASVSVSIFHAPAVYSPSG